MFLQLVQFLLIITATKLALLHHSKTLFDFIHVTESCNFIPQTQTSQILSIPKEHHRFILGKGGERLQKLETDTATKISIPKANEDTCDITITGPKDGIELAILRINDVSMEQGSKVCMMSFIFAPTCLAF